MTHLSGEGWPASYDSLSRCRELTGQKLEKADLAIFFGHHAKETKPKPKFGGIAHLGVACKGGAIDKRCQLNMWWYNPSVTASVVAHETGHNIGMEHDFYASHKASGCDKTGIMSYGSKPMRYCTELVLPIFPSVSLDPFTKSSFKTVFMLNYDLNQFLTFISNFDCFIVVMIHLKVS